MNSDYDPNKPMSDKKMIVDVKSDTSGYIEIGDWVIYVDDSTGERIIHSWDKTDIKLNSNGEKRGEIKEHTSMGTRALDHRDHIEWHNHKKNLEYIKDMLGEHDYREGSLLLNSEGHEVRDLEGQTIMIDANKIHLYSFDPSLYVGSNQDLTSDNV